MKLKYLFGFLIGLLCLSLYLFYIIYADTKNKAISELNTRQMIHARQAQRGIEDFFSDLMESLDKLSCSSHIIHLDEWGRREMELALTLHSDEIKAVSRMDASGKIIHTVPYESGIIGRDISDQKHVREILKTHRPVVSDALTVIQGYEAIALHVPVFHEDNFVGSLGVLIDFKYFAKYYLQDIRIGQTGYAWMINREGTELYCPVPGHTGKSVFENCKDFPSILTMAKDMLQGHSGTTIYYYDRVRKEETLESIKKHAVYLSIKIGDTFWSIVVASSEDELLSALVSFRNKLLAVAGLLLVFCSIISYYGAKVWGIVREVEERRKAEAALRENEEIFEQFMEHSPIYIFFKDEKIRSIRLSRNYEKMLGRPLEQILGKTMDALFPPDLAKSMIADDTRILTEGKVVHAEEELDGRNYTTIKFPIYLQGRPRYLAGYTIDITEQRRSETEKRQLEERLQRAEKMEAIGTLAGGVAHDLNNVLGVIIGYSELLLYSVPEDSPFRRRTEIIMEGGKKAAAIVQDLLTLARRGVPGRSILNLNKIVDVTLNSPEFGQLALAHPNVRVGTVLESDLLNISGSATHLGKSLFNLLSNAMEAMPNGGALTVRTGNQYLDKPIQGYDEIREGDYVVLSVTDIGEGIAEADLKRIFEPFYTKKMMGRKSGTGLGLSVVWGTVKDHHGYINVQSESERGTTFTLYFPVSREALTEEATAIPMEEYMGNGETVLVVDDVAEQRNLAMEMLERLNYRAESVSSGEEALDYIQARPVDLVVLDMIMDPGIDGLDTYRSILEIRPGQKAIIVSGFSESDRVSAALALGADAYVRKPYVMEKLGIAIKGALRRQSP